MRKWGSMRSDGETQTVRVSEWFFVLAAPRSTSLPLPSSAPCCSSFMDLSESLDPSKPPKTDKATIVTEAAQVITHLRKELTSLSAVLETVQKSNDTLEKEKTGLFADKAALLQDKHKLENQLHCFMSSMPFASPPPGMAFPTAFPTGAHHMMAPGNPGMKMAAHGSGGMMPVMWGFPPLVVHTTTAEEDAKLRAPVA